MHIPTNDFDIKISRIIMDEINQDCDFLHRKAEDNKSKMNCDQKKVFDEVIEAIEKRI